MYRLKLTFLLLFVVAASPWAQDSNADEEAATTAPAETQESADGDEVTDDEIDELLGLDEEWSDIDEEEFDPTEEVRFEQSIPFPVDI